MTEFYGTMTVENGADILEKIYKKLDGQTYTFVAVNDGFSWQSNTEVRTNQQIKGKPSWWYGDDDKYFGFNFNDSYGVWGVSTSWLENGYDPKFNAPYIVIEYRQIKITHRAPAGHLLNWVIALE